LLLLERVHQLANFQAGRRLDHAQLGALQSGIAQESQNHNGKKGCATEVISNRKILPKSRNY
jgi:hypothetical protein